MCGCLLHAAPTGTQSTIQACALTGNRTGDPLFSRPAFNPLSHTSQGPMWHNSKHPKLTENKYYFILIILATTKKAVNKMLTDKRFISKIYKELRTQYEKIHTKQSDLKTGRGTE